jgi:dipeptidyl aminopeptidase/acylaminoacyl peptidase
MVSSGNVASLAFNVRQRAYRKSAVKSAPAFVRVAASRYGSWRVRRGWAMMARWRALFAGLAISTAPSVAAAAPDFTMAQVRDYPFISELDTNEHGGHIAFVRDVHGTRNVWVADAPVYAPRQITQYKNDDGQEITQLTFSPDGKSLIYVRGGDHDANWAAPGDLAPDPDSSPDQPKVTILLASMTGGASVKIAEGDAPAISSRGQLAYIAEHQVWTISLDGKGKPQKLFFDHGKDSGLQWSPDGSELAFVSNRDDHALIGIYRVKDRFLSWLAPSTDKASMPRWSTDGKEVAFVRRPGNGGAPKPILIQTSDPWSIWIADAATGQGHLVWQSPNTLLGSYPQTEGGANLHWAGGRLVFLAEFDNWPHLYSVPMTGGTPLLLTPGAFMVEDVVESRDGRFLIYSANTGTTKDDDDRRHIFRVATDAAAPIAVTSGEGLELKPVLGDDAHVAFIDAGAKAPNGIGLAGSDGKARRELNSGGVPADFPRDALTVPKSVSFKSADGFTIHGQLFDDGSGTPKPGIIFVHGGPPRQMLLGWHYMDYYANGYAVNQYLAAHGFVVLSVNYRLGIGYGRAFQHPDHAGAKGAAEYKDVQAGAKFLQGLKDVDPSRIGIWGGSYGGYLTGLALARNSDVFKAGVDLMGVHDWSRVLQTDLGAELGLGAINGSRYEKGDLDQAMKVAFESSPDADVARWKSPVLLIQGDDDRNVEFQQTIDLAARLEAHHVPYEELILPNEIHGFLRWESWTRADIATAAFLAKELGAAKAASLRN